MSMVEPRLCTLGGENKKRGFFGPGAVRRMLPLLLVGAIAVGVLAFTGSILILIVELLACAIGYLWYRRHDLGLTGSTKVGKLQRKVSGWLGLDTYTHKVGPDGLRILPREVGARNDVSFLAATVRPGTPYTALIRHDRHGYFSGVLEVVGGGDGCRDTLETNLQGLRFGQILYGASRNDLPVEQLDPATRVRPSDAAKHLEWLKAKQADAGWEGTPLGDNLVELASLVNSNAESYRTWLPVRMPVDALTAQLKRDGIRPTGDNLAEAAVATLGKVASIAKNNGIPVIGSLGTRSLAGLIRSHYLPHYKPDEYSDLSGPREAFPEYDGRHRIGFRTWGPDGRVWWHATCSVPRDGWPMRAVGVRWLQALVTDVTPPVIHTVVAQHRLVPKGRMRKEAALSLTLDDAELLSMETKGKTSTGEAEAQSAASEGLLQDLLYERAAGDRVALHVTVSAESPAALAAARDAVESAAQDAELNRLTWHDWRHHHAHLLTAPLLRGMKVKK